MEDPWKQRMEGLRDHAFIYIVLVDWLFWVPKLYSAVQWSEVVIKDVS